jgi:transcription elongation factor GreB
VSRYRPPTPPGSKYITPEGAKRLKDELNELWHDERPRVTQSVAEAAAQGDRSENAEYTYGKKRLHEIDRRVRFLRKRLEGMTIVDPSTETGRRDPTRIYFGAWMQLQSEHAGAGEQASERAQRWYRLVGPDEFDMAANYISMDSPLGRSLLGKRLDDDVSLALPGGTTVYTVLAISYELKPPERS